MANRRTPIGEMRKRITIQKIDTTRTAGGETTDTPSTFAKVWARIRPLSGAESWVAKELQSVTSHQLNLLYYPGITERMQAVYQGRTFNFISVRDLEEMHEELEILAKEATLT